MRRAKGDRHRASLPGVGPLVEVPSSSPALPQVHVAPWLGVFELLARASHHVLISVCILLFDFDVLSVGGLTCF